MQSGTAGAQPAAEPAVKVASFGSELMNVVGLIDCGMQVGRD
ncbi:hypothetical protein [Deinococcus sp. PESE-13]